MSLPVRAESGFFSRYPASVRVSMMVATGMLLAACAARPGHVTQPNMLYLVPVNHGMPPELSGHADVVAPAVPPAAQAGGA